MIHKIIPLNKDKDYPKITTYILDDCLEQQRKRPIIIICPGGGYNYCSKREGEAIALAFNRAGFHSVILEYSVNCTYPSPLIDLSKTIVMVRENAKEWCVDTDKVIVCGFSAGGHLAATHCAYWNTDKYIKRDDELNKPNGAILCYPVITSGEYAHRGSLDTICGKDSSLYDYLSIEKHITKDFPPTFLWHTFTDNAVPVENSLMLAVELAKNKISTEMHIYPMGEHGLSLATKEVAYGDEGIIPYVSGWIDLATNWVSTI